MKYLLLCALMLTTGCTPEEKKKTYKYYISCESFPETSAIEVKYAEVLSSGTYVLRMDDIEAKFSPSIKCVVTRIIVP